MIISFIIYAALASLAYLPVYPLDPSSLPNCGCGDVSQSAWFMSWDSYTLFHGMNPFLTNYLNYPLGANLAVSAQGFLYGALLSPVTHFINAIASYNLLLWASFPLSALAMYFVTYSFTKNRLPAFLSGLFYGFSPYVIDQGLAHLNLIFIPFPPLIFYQLYRIFISQDVSKYRSGILLGIYIIFQYMMSSEILATTTIISMIALFILAVSKRNLVLEHIRKSLIPVAVTLIISILALGYPIWYSIKGPLHLIIPIHAWNNQFHADLLGTIIPTYGQLLYPLAWKTRGSSFLQFNWIENGSYLGIPILLTVGIIVIRLRKNPWVRFSFIMAVLAWLLSLGPYLTIDGHTTSIPLPFNLLANLPILNNILPSRFAMYTDLFLAILLALGINELITSNFFRKNTINRNTTSAFINFLQVVSNWRVIGIFLLFVACILSLIPGWPYTAGPSPIANTYSSFFRNDKYLIPDNAVALTYPYPLMTDNQAMVWQLLSNMRFKLLGGYNLFTIPPGYPDGQPAILQPENIESIFSYEADGLPYPLTKPPLLSTITPKSISLFVDTNHVQIILVNQEALHAQFILEKLTQTFGKPTTSGYGITLYVLKHQKN